MRAFVTAGTRVAVADIDGEFVKLVDALTEDQQRKFLRENKPWNALAKEILQADGADPATRPAARFALDRGVQVDVVLETEVIENCGHWTQIEQPKALNAILIDWLHRKINS